jgi:hypothetical protein
MVIIDIIILRFLIILLVNYSHVWNQALCIVSIQSMEAFDDEKEGL